MRIVPGHMFSRQSTLHASVSLVALTLVAGAAQAQPTDIGSVDVQSTAPATGGFSLPLGSDAAVGSKAPPGSAPALAPSQSSLNAIEPESIVSDKVIRDIAPPSADFNDAVKFTPGWVSSNPNGLVGDAKGGWRGFADGQYNITFDGIPFGDANDPTHHSAAYFPGAFLGSIVIDRGPGPASQVGYAPFGGTMALNSYDLSDAFGGHVDTSYGSFNTFTSSLTVQSGLIPGTGVRALFQYAHSNTSGALNYGHYDTNQSSARSRSGSTT
jgi:iron complex outermembrane receptor protein